MITAAVTAIKFAALLAIAVPASVLIFAWATERLWGDIIADPDISSAGNRCRSAARWGKAHEDRNLRRSPWYF